MNTTVVTAMLHFFDEAEKIKKKEKLITCCIHAVRVAD